MSSDNATQISEEDRRRCVLLFRLQKIGVHQWRRVGQPVVDTEGDGDFSNPVINEVRPGEVELRVFDSDGLDFTKHHLLGDYRKALERCEQAFAAQFPDQVIVTGSLNDY